MNNIGHEWEVTRARRVGELEHEWHEQYGSVFRLAGIFGEDILEVSDPRALQHICHKSAYRYKKPMDMEQQIEKTFGPGLATVNGEIHQRQRKIMNPVFSAAQIRPFAPVFETCVQSCSPSKLIAKWRSDIESGATTINCFGQIHGMTLNALGEAMFEYDFDAMAQKKGGLRDILRDLLWVELPAFLSLNIQLMMWFLIFSLDSGNPTQLKMLRNASYRFLPKPIITLLGLKKTKEDRRFAHWIAASQNVSKGLITQKAESLGGVEKNTDILSVIARSLAAQDPTKSLFPVEALSQMATIIFAGHETTASTLTWLLYEMAHNPEWQTKLIQEIQEVRDKTGNDGPLAVKDLEVMPILNAVIKETLRFHPIAPDLVREAETDDVIPLSSPIIDSSGTALKEIPVTKGQRIIMNIFEYNRFKSVWGDDANVWSPERYLDSDRPTTLGVYANLMTFSGGVRSCIGWRFAVLELQVATVALIEAFNFSPVQGIEIEHVRAGSNPPLVKGKWAAGPQLPLKVCLRRPD
ncbi:hypothetical protein AAF712_009524 [Marasmius tenuissimus]|uniref:Cytochrome P450 n=1 Tax=Marasmius tenuissimus TaxID=585030 RepID=A0ABR2ZQT3_9AGAR